VGVARALAPFPKVALWLLRDARQPDADLANLADWGGRVRRRRARSPDERERFAEFMRRWCSSLRRRRRQ
jgi:hypothetical protein